jgi:serine/threonine protein kinase
MIKDGELYLIDFGFATFYVNADKEHISIDRTLESILGTPKYISIYNHMGISNSRRDDMISLGYIMFYLRGTADSKRIIDSRMDAPSCHSDIKNNSVYNTDRELRGTADSKRIIDSRMDTPSCHSGIKNDSVYNKPDEKMLENHGGYERSHILHPMNQILKKEKEIERIENLCKNDHPSIYYYLKTCYEIEYHEAPDYSFLKDLFS